jgi:hypothetical protein
VVGVVESGTFDIFAAQSFRCTFDREAIRRGQKVRRLQKTNEPFDPVRVIENNAASTYEIPKYFQSSN